MYKTSLFLGVPLTEEYQTLLDQANPGLVALFTKGGTDYLETCEVDSVRYLGKFLGEFTELARLELVEANVCSLLKRLVPNYSYSSLVLVAKRESSSE